jgi:hypothetical protein
MRCDVCVVCLVDSSRVGKQGAMQNQQAVSEVSAPACRPFFCSLLACLSRRWTTHSYMYIPYDRLSLTLSFIALHCIVYCHSCPHHPESADGRQQRCGCKPEQEVVQSPQGKQHPLVQTAEWDVPTGWQQQQQQPRGSSTCQAVQGRVSVQDGQSRVRE